MVGGAAVSELRASLERLAATRGVASAAVASRDGFVLDGVGRDDEQRDYVAGLASGALAASQALADLFAEGPVRQVTLEFDRGPVLLVPLEGEASNHLVMLVLDDLGALGRVRLQLRRLLPELSERVAS